jgi:integrase
MLAALTGMRRGELCALRWSDVDLERGELDVSRSVVVAVGGLVQKSTKTDRFRRVALDEVGVLLLRQHLANVQRWAREAGAAVPAAAFVFRISTAASRSGRTTSPVSSSGCGTPSGSATFGSMTFGISRQPS